MAPRRKAAAAAQAAMAASANEGNDVEQQAIDDEAYEEAFQPEEPSKPKRASKSKSKLAVSATRGAVVIDNPAPVDTLPFELRHEVLRYLDEDPYSVLCLLTVSKVWYLTLMSGKHANAGWERRCKAMGATRKSRGCKKWHETFIALLQKKCVVCFKPAKFPVGQLLLRDYKYLLTCEENCAKSGPFSFELITRTAHRHGLHCDTLIMLPTRPWPTPWQVVTMPGSSKKCPSQYKRGILKATKSQFLLHLEGTIKGCPRSLDSKTLAVALEHSRKGQRPISTVLNDAVRVLELAYEPQKQHYATVIQVYLDMKKALGAVCTYFARGHVEMFDPMPEVFKWKTENGKLEVISWIDAILTEEATLEDYLRVLKKEIDKQDILISKSSDTSVRQGREGCIIA